MVIGEDEIEQRVLHMFSVRAGSYIFRKKQYDKYTAESNIHFDVQLDQDDVEEFVDDFAKEFGVDMSGFHLETYYPEVKFSWNPFKKPDPVDIPDFTIGMFIKSAKARKWLYD